MGKINKINIRKSGIGPKILLSIFITLAYHTSCKKKEEAMKEKTIPATTTEKGLKTGSISGLLLDMDSEDTPIPGANVTLKVDLNGDGTFSSSSPKEIFFTKTEDDGTFSFTGVPISRDGKPIRAVITFEKENFGSNTKILEVTGDSMITGRMRGQISSDMTKQNNMVTGRFVTGRMVTGRAVRIRGVQEGKTVVEVEIPENSIPNSVQQITGYVTYVNPAQEPEIFPGEFLAKNPKSQKMSPLVRILRLITRQEDEPEEVRLESAGLAEIVLKDEKGRNVPVNGESVIKILIPKDTWITLKDSDPNTSDKIEVPLWYFNEKEGIWEQHSEYGWVVDSNENPIPASELNKIKSGQYNGDIYSYGKVPHFSWWNTDWPITSHACICGKISQEDNTGNKQPLQNITVMLKGKTYTGSTYAYTDRYGVFCGDVKRSETGTEIYKDWVYSENHTLLDEQPTANTGGQEKIEVIVETGTVRLSNVKVKVESGEELDWSSVGTPSSQGTKPGTESNPCRWIGEFTIKINREIKGTLLEDRGNGEIAPLPDIPIASSSGQVGRTDSQGKFRFFITPNTRARIFSSGLFSKDIEAGESPVDLGQIVVKVDKDGDGYAKFEDCDDLNPFVNPGASEKCDGIDNNCNGIIDEGFDVGQVCLSGTGRCQQSGLKVCNAQGTGTFCNAVPLQPQVEICNNIDDNCNGSIDEGGVCGFSSGGGGGGGTTTCPDNDLDGFLASYCGGTDCNDNSANINPNAQEICDGVDNNCNGEVDEGNVCQPEQASCYDENNDGIPDVERFKIKRANPQEGRIVQAGETLTIEAEIEIAKPSSSSFSDHDRYYIGIISYEQNVCYYSNVLTYYSIPTTQPGCYNLNYSFQVTVPANSSAIALVLSKHTYLTQDWGSNVKRERIIYPVSGTNWIMITSVNPPENSEIEVDSIAPRNITINVSYNAIEQSNLVALILGGRYHNEQATYSSVSNISGTGSTSFTIPVQVTSCIDQLSIYVGISPYDTCPYHNCGNQFDFAKIYVKYTRPFLYLNYPSCNYTCLSYYSSDYCSSSCLASGCLSNSIILPIVFNTEDWPSKTTNFGAMMIYSCQSLNSDFNITDNISGPKWLSYSPKSGQVPPSTIYITADTTKMSSQTPQTAILTINSSSAINTPITVPVVAYFVDLDITSLPLTMRMGESYNIGISLDAPPKDYCLHLAYSSTSNDPTTLTTTYGNYNLSNDWGTISLACVAPGTYSVNRRIPDDDPRICNKVANFSIMNSYYYYDWGNESFFSEVLTAYVQEPTYNVIRIDNNDYWIYLLRDNNTDPVTRIIKVEEVCGRSGTFNIQKGSCSYYDTTQNQSLATNCDWLSISPTSGNFPQDVLITANPVGLQDTTYYASITITSPGAYPKILNIQFDRYRQD